MYSEVEGFTSPKIKENYYVFGIEQSIEVKDDEGNVVQSVSGAYNDIDSHLEARDEHVIFNSGIGTSSLGPGKYSMKIMAYDKISRIRASSEEVAFEVR